VPAGPPREKVKLYTHTLGGALRGAGKHEFDDRFDAIPLVVIAEVPNRVAADLNKHGQLYQHVVAHVSKTMQAMIRDKIAPKINPSWPVDDILRASVSKILADNSPGVGKAIEAQIAQHYSTLGEWHAVRKHTAIDGAIVTVTLSLSAAAFGLSGFTMGVSGAAAIIGLVRGIIDGMEKLVQCWKTVDEWGVRIDNDVKSLDRAYDRGMGAGRATQIGGGVLRSSGLGKAATLVSGRDLTPSIASIEGNIAVYRGKVAHLYAFLDRMTMRLVELLDQQQVQDNDRVARSIAALLEGRGTARGRLVGFRGRYTIPVGIAMCAERTKMAETYATKLRDLRARDDRAGLVAMAVQAAEVTTNAGFAAINYPAIFNGAGGGSAAATFAVDGEGSAVTAAAFGMFNDAIGTLKDAFGIMKGALPDDPGTAAREREVRLEFAALPGAPPRAAPARRHSA